MTTSKPAPGYLPNPDYSQADWDEVSDTPELTDAEIAELRPNGETLPVELAGAFKRLGGSPQIRGQGRAGLPARAARRARCLQGRWPWVADQDEPGARRRAATAEVGSSSRTTPASARCAGGPAHR